MPKILSLKARLIAVSTAWIAFGMIAAWIALSAIFQHHVSKQFYEELFVHLEELRRLTTITDGRADILNRLSDPRYDVASSGYYWEVQKAGRVLARSTSLLAAPLRTPPDERSDVGVHTHVIPGPTGVLLVAEKLEWTSPSDVPVQYIIGTDKRHLDHVVDGFNATLSWSLTGLGLSMVLAAALLILYAMRPLDQLRASLLQVRGGKSKALAGSFPSEIQPLIDDLNGMLGSTAELVQRARTQAGNIAHGLKTPLAILTDEGYRVGEQGLQANSAVILEQCRKMQNQIDYHTTRARVVATRLSPGASTSAGETAREVTNALSRLHRDRGISFEVDIAGDVRVACDHQDLQELLANLLDNAGKHAKSRVRVATAASPHINSVAIAVEDDGAGLPPEAYEVVFDIGERWDTQIAGSGLGLAIARDLATLYGGGITLDTSELGGLKAVVTLPGAR